MEREFIILPEFDKLWKSYGFTDDDLRKLEDFLGFNPNVGSLIKGTNGLRKIRWSISGKGKRGGVRIAYVDFVFFEKIYLISVFKKNEKKNFSNKEKNKIAKFISVLENELKMENQDEK